LRGQRQPGRSSGWRWRAWRQRCLDGRSGRPPTILGGNTVVVGGLPVVIGGINGVVVSVSPGLVLRLASLECGGGVIVAELPGGIGANSVVGESSRVLSTDHALPVGAGTIAESGEVVVLSNTSLSSVSEAVDRDDYKAKAGTVGK